MSGRGSKQKVLPKNTLATSSSGSSKKKASGSQLDSYSQLRYLKEIC